MPLKTAKTKEEIPAQFQAGAVEAKDGTFAYEDDGGLKAKNTELINTNRELSDRIGSIERSLGGLKPEEITETVQKAKDAEEEALRKAGDIPAILERKLKPKDDEIAALKKLVEEKTAAHNDVVISNHIEETMTKIGVLPDERGTVRDLLRFRKNIRLDDKGKPVAYDDDGSAESKALLDLMKATFGDDFGKVVVPVSQKTKIFLQRDGHNLLSLAALGAALDELSASEDLDLQNLVVLIPNRVGWDDSGSTNDRVLNMVKFVLLRDFVVGVPVDRAALRNIGRLAQIIATQA